jgi:hypothetical protein
MPLVTRLTNVGARLRDLHSTALLAGGAGTVLSAPGGEIIAWQTRPCRRGLVAITALR